MKTVLQCSPCWAGRTSLFIQVQLWRENRIPSDSHHCRFCVMILRTQGSAPCVDSQLSGCDGFRRFPACPCLALSDCKVQRIPAQTAGTWDTAWSNAHSCRTGTCAGKAGAPSWRPRSGTPHSPCCSPPPAPLRSQPGRPSPTSSARHSCLQGRGCWRGWGYYLQTWKVAESQRNQ